MANALCLSMSSLGLLWLTACAGTGPNAPNSAWDTHRADTREPMAPPITTTPPSEEFSVTYAGGGLALEPTPSAPTPAHVVYHQFKPKVTRIDRTGSVAPAEPVVTDTVSPVAPVAEESLSDAQIVNVLETIQTADIATTEIVAARTENERVKDFAQRVQRSNQEQRQRVATLAKTTPTTPEDSAFSADLRIRASQQLTQAQLTPTAQLDRAFLDGQVGQNQERIELIDARLMPEAEDPKLQAELKQSRADLKQRILDAQQMRNGLEAQETSTPLAP